MVLTDDELREIAKQFPDIRESLDKLVGKPNMFDPSNKFSERSEIGLKLSQSMLSYAREVARVAASK